MRKERINYYLRMAKDASERSTCQRRKCGCVLTYKNRVVGIGYNGSPAGMAHCDEVGCLIHDGHCIRTIHAEMSALSTAGLNPLYMESGQLICYLTAQPCYNCYKALVAFGVSKIYCIDEVYIDERRDKLIEFYKVPVIQMEFRE